ncbi:hypothetical protein DEI93_12295 [Curtobacterium sp. MCBD17_035]|uniref:hypothetical protein n=1 Tax=Curtobacterium sp. MCBD17_035 TaxID=2175673 RepID=UPI001C652EB1|nr:hypothetical protein [Curtobacterium sp. MCBD17_035]WIB66738.1 hypothetical protein DEI93_12295 [Curtobacterium sp. MCBD17_035]
MSTDLDVALAAHRAAPFPDAVERGEQYGLVDAVMIDSDIVGWATEVSAGGVLAPEAVRGLRQCADGLSASLIAFPEAARVYYVHLLLVAELALRDDALRIAGTSDPLAPDTVAGDPEREATTATVPGAGPEAARRPRSGLAGLFRASRSSHPQPTPDPAAFVPELESILFSADPVGIAFETNTDEYRPEAETIALRLPDATSVDDVQRIIHEEFVAWFDASTAGPALRYRALAARVWLLWSERG